MSTNTNSLSVIYSNKGGPQLVLDCFVFKLNKRTETKIYMLTDANSNLLTTNGEHNHLPESEDFMMRKFRAVPKERVVNETIPIQKIYHEEIVKANFISDTLASVPPIHQLCMITSNNIGLYFLSLESGLNRVRRKLTPTLLTSNLFDILPGYQTTASGETFLICDKMVSRKKGMLMFSSPKQLQLLFEGSMVFLDGTFQATPPFFDEVFTIHCFKFDCGYNLNFVL